MEDSRRDLAEMATARANVYGLLADVFRQEPSTDFLKRLRAPEFSGALEALGLSLGEMLKTTPEDQLAEKLAIEYTRLFIGPGPHVLPNESIHVTARLGETNSLWGPATVAVKKFMEGAGVSIADSFSGMPDHITAEFEFQQQLLLKEAEAWRAGDDLLATNILNIEKRFWDEHLSQWVAAFCEKVMAATTDPFFSQFCDVTRKFIAFEGETLEDQIDRVAAG